MLRLLAIWLRIETELCSARDRSIVGQERRRIDLLLEMGVGDARNARDAAAELAARCADC